MEIIGVLGGMSWPSTLEYYRLMNEAAQARLGPDRSAEILLYSLDWGRIERLQHAGDWDALSEELITGARRLVLGGAGFLVIATNTMHKVADAVAAVSGLEVLHIADATARALREAGVRRAGLLGTRFTMEEPFMRERLEGWGLEVLVPEPEDREAVHRIIYEELVQGVVRDASREVYRGMMARLVERGAGGIVLGCTEIGLLVGPEDAPVPVFDTTRIHAEAAVARALGG
ncbi:aspartate/glutamate racemase family protein [Oceanithermus desulfurans]|uniref:Aspartate racemase n=2 Tax=Oceanithermus desulfurans TaxID=227924 RepID=A0A511RMN8_9DEIN|nr:aspartate/glutamate racemase family protein [Oceanithermus desulfurans]MBB6030524.1 aspartate racemase [Oceanithermus desulfurans]GEM90066.1 aspartate racemase [Oceanithermus desulfurans NBRC 100063]